MSRRCIGRPEPRSQPNCSSKACRRCRSRMPKTPMAIASRTHTGRERGDQLGQRHHRHLAMLIQSDAKARTSTPTRIHCSPLQWAESRSGPSTIAGSEWCSRPRSRCATGLGERDMNQARSQLPPERRGAGGRLAHAAGDDRAGTRDHADDAHGRTHGRQLARRESRVPGCRGRIARFRGVPARSTCASETLVSRAPCRCGARISCRRTCATAIAWWTTNGTRIRRRRYAGSHRSDARSLDRRREPRLRA